MRMFDRPRINRWLCHRFWQVFLVGVVLLAGVARSELSAAVGDDAAEAPKAAVAEEGEAKPSQPHFVRFKPRRAPRPSGRLLEPGDRLAICGDSITEQRMYSRILETYLTVCWPEWEVDVRQYGWSGETAPQFLARMTNDCLRFQPTIATTCYGMNDHGYRPYEPGIGAAYLEASRAIIRAFKQAEARVVLGSPGCVGPKVPWSKSSGEEMNLNLCELRNLGIGLASSEGVGFADVFWPMFTAAYDAQERFGPDYAVCGKDGVHPDWVGSLIMAYAFLRALGVDGDLGTFTVDLAAGTASATGGHEIHGLSQGALTVTSHRYPFCAGGPLNRDDSLRSAMTLVPFNADLNRLQLVVTGTTHANYRVVWGETSRVYSAAALAQGINLADDFVLNPFSAPFRKVDEAVAAKQAYETRQIKMLFHGDEGRVDMEATVALTEAVREGYVGAVDRAFEPVTHTLRILPEN